MNDEKAVAFAALAASLQTFRVLVNRGLVSPNEVEVTYSSITQAVRNASDEMRALVESALATPFAEYRQVAKERWIGRGNPDPEKLS
jgi:hypothetical protein